MTKKDYEKAAQIVQDVGGLDYADKMTRRQAAIEVFTALFTGDNPRFNPDRFIRACQPGANVRARRVA